MSGMEPALLASMAGGTAAAAAPVAAGTMAAAAPAAAGLAGSLAPAVAAGTAAAPVATMAAGASPFAAAAPALGSGVYGLETLGGLTGGIGAAGPTSVGAVAQGVGPLGGALLPTEATLSKLANAPLDPAKIMQLLKQQPGGEQQRAPSPGSPAGGSRVSGGEDTKTGRLDSRKGLASYLGR